MAMIITLASFTLAFISTFWLGRVMVEYYFDRSYQRKRRLAKALVIFVLIQLVAFGSYYGT